jgi:hypothetical protein
VLTVLPKARAGKAKRIARQQQHAAPHLPMDGMLAVAHSADKNTQPLRREARK